MTLFRVIETTVVSEPEFFSRSAEILEKAGRTEGGALEGTSRRRGPMSRAGEVVGFEPIGKGKPLQVVIDRIYTGKYPKKGGLFGSASDVAVVSGVKDYSVFAASTRALNVLTKDVRARSHVRGTAFEDGTPLVLYSPAVMTDSLTLTVEIAVDSFDSGLFDTVAKGFSAAAGIPLMLPYSGYLLGASEVLKLAGGVGDALFDGRPAFSITETLNFGLPGRPLAIADHWLLTHNQDLNGFSYDAQKGLIDSNGAPYAGDDPYVVLTLDGKERPELNKFTPTAASAAILQKFFNMKDRTAASVETIVEGMQLVSDLRLRKKAETLKARAEAATDPTAKASLNAELEAVLKNIDNEALKPK